VATTQLRAEPLADAWGEWCDHCQTPTVIVTPIALYPPLHEHRLALCTTCHHRQNLCRLGDEFVELPWVNIGVACAAKAP
jgi:hypothetical protein